MATLEGNEHELEIAELTTRSYKIKLADVEHELDVQRVGPSCFSILVGGRSFDLDVVRDGDELIVLSRGRAIRVTLASLPSLPPAAPGRQDVPSLPGGRK
jgi:hypothetical protein